ncbi:TadE family protein [Nocardioides sp.]|uniref:TadE family protein n=1 Tax=Nocardioides sp. TaxID=35761 RepID=UPI00321B080F
MGVVNEMGRAMRLLGLRGRRRDDDGAAAVEFALVVPFLLVILFGIISYGVMLSFRQSLSQAATEGARAAAVTINPLEKQAEAFAAVEDALSTFDVACDGTDMTRDGAVVGACSVSAPGACVPAASTGVQCVTVTLTFDYRDNPIVPNFPLVGVIIPRELTYSAQARVS